MFYHYDFLDMRSDDQIHLKTLEASSTTGYEWTDLKGYHIGILMEG